MEGASTARRLSKPLDDGELELVVEGENNTPVKPSALLRVHSTSFKEHVRVAHSACSFLLQQPDMLLLAIMSVLTIILVLAVEEVKTAVLDQQQIGIFSKVSAVHATNSTIKPVGSSRAPVDVHTVLTAHAAAHAAAADGTPTPTPTQIAPSSPPAGSAGSSPSAPSPTDAPAAAATTAGGTSAGGTDTAGAAGAATLGSITSASGDGSPADTDAISVIGSSSVDAASTANTTIADAPDATASSATDVSSGADATAPHHGTGLSEASPFTLQRLAAAAGNGGAGAGAAGAGGISAAFQGEQGAPSPSSGTTGGGGGTVGNDAIASGSSDGAMGRDAADTGGDGLNALGGRVEGSSSSSKSLSVAPILRGSTASSLDAAAAASGNLHPQPTQGHAHAHVHGGGQHGTGTDRSGGAAAGRPLSIAHRGASSELPEHTVEGYLRAIEEGADFIECDVVLTLDLVPICRHSPHLDDSTNARELFPDRVRTHTIDGEELSGVFSFDLLWSEVQRLGAVQPWPTRNHSRDGQLAVPSLAQFLALAAAAPRPVGVYPETKHPTFTNALPALRAANTTLEAILAHALHRHGFAAPHGSAAWRAAPVFVQSFEAASLQAMRTLVCAPLVLLLGAQQGWAAPDSNLTLAQLTSDASLRGIAGWAFGLGMAKGSLVTWVDDGGEGVTEGQALAGTGRYVSAGLVERAHGHGLQVHVYTLRPEAQFVLPHLDGRVAAEYSLLLLGEDTGTSSSDGGVVHVDGLFTDSIPTLAAWLQTHPRPDLDLDGGPQERGRSEVGARPSFSLERQPPSSGSSSSSSTLGGKSGCLPHDWPAERAAAAAAASSSSSSSSNASSSLSSQV